MLNNNMWSWLTSFWTNADTSTLIRKDNGQGLITIWDWQQGGCSNTDKLPSFKSWKKTLSEILKYKKGFWSTYKTIWRMCISPLLTTKLKWYAWSNFSSNRPYIFIFNLLTMKIRQEMYESVGDQYGICGITRYRFQERFIWSDKWTDWKTFKCYDVDDHSPKTDEDYEAYEADYEEGYDY